MTSSAWALKSRDTIPDPLNASNTRSSLLPSRSFTLATAPAMCPSSERLLPMYVMSWRVRYSGFSTSESLTRTACFSPSSASCNVSSASNTARPS